jgi:hypothetical protein
MAVMTLFARTKPDGGGNSEFNPDPLTGEAHRAWAEIHASTQNADASGAAPGFHGSTTGISGGADGDFGQGARFGFALGYDSNSLRDNSGGEASADTYRGSLYGSEVLGHVGLGEVVSYARGLNDTVRATGAGAGRASFTTDQVTAAIQASAPFRADDILFVPSAGVMVSRLTAKNFSETDATSAAFAVRGVGQDVTWTSPYANLDMSREFTTASGTVFVPDVLVGYRYNPAASGQAFALTAADGTAFSANKVDLKGGAALVGLNLTAHSGTWSAYVKYRAQFGRGWTDQNSSVGFRVTF